MIGEVALSISTVRWDHSALYVVDSAAERRAVKKRRTPPQPTVIDFGQVAWVEVTRPSGFKPGWVEFGRYGAQPLTRLLDASGSERCVQFGPKHEPAVAHLVQSVRALLASRPQTPAEQQERELRFDGERVYLGVTALRIERTLGGPEVIAWDSVRAVIADRERQELVIEHSDGSESAIVVLSRPRPVDALADAARIAMDRAGGVDRDAQLFQLGSGRLVLHRDMFVSDQFALKLLGEVARRSVQLCDVAEFARPFGDESSTVDVIPVAEVMPGLVPKPDTSVRQIISATRYLEFSDGAEAKRFVAAAAALLAPRRIDPHDVVDTLRQARVPHPSHSDWEHFTAASYGDESGAIVVFGGRLLFVNPYSRVASVREWDLRVLIDARPEVVGEGAESAGVLVLNFLGTRTRFERMPGAAAVAIAHSIGLAHPSSRWAGAIGARQSAAMRAAQVFHRALIDRVERRPVVETMHDEIVRALEEALMTRRP